MPEPEDPPRGSSGGLTIQVELGGAGVKLRLRRRLPDDHPAYALIGRVAAEWARLEHVLDAMIWELAGISPETGSSFTGAIFQIRSRMTILLSLMRKKRASNEAMKLVKEIRKEIKDVAEARNQYVHHAWFIEEDDAGASALGQIKGVTLTTKDGFTPIEEGNIEETAKAIGRVSLKAGRLRNLLFAEPTPSPDKQVG